MKIVIITTRFPCFDLSEPGSATKFIYFYAVEWVKQGHEVLVLHSQRRYPDMFIRALSFLEHRVGVRFRKLMPFMQDAACLHASRYNVDGIRVIRTPIKKMVPHRDYLSGHLKKHRGQVLASYLSENFDADFAISDFLTPSIYIAIDLKMRCGLPFFQVFHDTDFEYAIRSKRLLNLLGHARALLLRSPRYLSRIKHLGKIELPCELVFSGIPNDLPLGKPKTSLKKLLFAGSLIPRKRVDVILNALSRCKGRSYFSLDIIGDGVEKESLVAKAAVLNLQKQVTFVGRLSREGVIERMRNADGFVMVSSETFGMVYVEALSQGCVTVACKNQGVDGIIEDGKNGFLVELDDVTALTRLLDRMMVMDDVTIRQISVNALRTASWMREGQLAYGLLKRLKSLLEDPR